MPWTPTCTCGTCPKCPNRNRVTAYRRRRRRTIEDIDSMMDSRASDRGWWKKFEHRPSASDLYIGRVSSVAWRYSA